MLKETIRSEFNNARKTGDNIKKSALEAVIAGILIKEKSGSGKDLTDNDVIDCLTKEIKVQKEILEHYINTPKGEEISLKIAALSAFLPKQLTEDEVLTLIKKLDIYEDASPKTKGLIIKSLMPEVTGKFEKALINPLLEKYLANK